MARYPTRNSQGVTFLLSTMIASARTTAAIRMASGGVTQPVASTGAAKNPPNSPGRNVSKTPRETSSATALAGTGLSAVWLAVSAT
jgi:hypothetical protein